MRELRHRRLWLSIGFALVGLVIYLSLTPKPIDAGEMGGVKIGHFFAYFVLMLWFAQLIRAWPGRIAVAAAFAVMGVGLEYAQGMTAYRTFGYDDMRDNAIGVAIGLAVSGSPLGLLLLRLEEWMGA